MGYIPLKSFDVLDEQFILLIFRDRDALQIFDELKMCS
jgi:hypothetical protein